MTLFLQQFIAGLQSISRVTQLDSLLQGLVKHRSFLWMPSYSDRALLCRDLGHDQGMNWWWIWRTTQGCFHFYGKHSRRSPRREKGRRRCSPCPCPCRTWWARRRAMKKTWWHNKTTSIFWWGSRRSRIQACLVEWPQARPPEELLHLPELTDAAIPLAWVASACPRCFPPTPKDIDKHPPTFYTPCKAPY